MAEVIQKRWFHGTTKENWKKIKEEGILWSPYFWDTRVTFLARNLEQLWHFFCNAFPANGDMHLRYELILSVKYIPNGVDDDYYRKDWELQVKRPIPLKDIKVQFYI